MRCMVREPRRLGAMRVQVSISIGSLTDRYAFTTALRGVDTVVHLASATRDQKSGSIEELNALATRRLIDGAERQGVQRVMMIAPLAASRHSGVRYYRSAAYAEMAVRESQLEATVFKTSMIYARDDRYVGLLAKWSRVLPVMPLFGGRDAEFEPIAADDAAEVLARVIAGEAEPADPDAVELVGPEVLTNEQIARIAMRTLGHRRPLLPVPLGLAHRTFDWAQRQFGPAAIATPDEIDLLTVTARSRRGTADMVALGVEPRSMNVALGD